MANPEEGVAEVESWADFLAAVANQEVTVIKVVKDFEVGNTNAEINGGIIKASGRISYAI